MTVYSAILTLHVLAWVLWLGTGLGAYYSSKRSQRADYAVDTRLALLDLGRQLDRAPRFAVPAAWTTGMLLMNRSGFEILSDGVAVGIGLAWLIVVWLSIFQALGSQLQVGAVRLQTIAYAIVIVAMGGYGVWALFDGSLPSWLAVKWLAFALVAGAAIWLERALAPLQLSYQQLAESGSTAELEAELHANFKPAYRAVLTMAIATLIAGIAGIAKFGF